MPARMGPALGGWKDTLWLCWWCVVCGVGVVLLLSSFCSRRQDGGGTGARGVVDSIKLRKRQVFEEGSLSPIKRQLKEGKRR